MTTLSVTFLGSLPEGLRATAAGASDLEAVLDVGISAATRAWPKVAVIDGATVASYAAARIGRPERVADLANTRWADLYLACACVRGDPAAATTVGKTFGPKLRAALAKLRIDAALADDVEQTVLERLLVPRGDAPPKIADYDGSGELGSWLSVVAVREALYLVKKGKRDVALGDELAAAPRVTDDDPELAFFKAKYRAEYRYAVMAAAEALTPDQRLLLRQHFLHGLTVDQIGSLLGVHRASAARRVSQAREELLANTRRELVVRLGVSREEIERIVEMIQSRLDVSLRQVLGG